MFLGTCSLVVQFYRTPNRIGKKELESIHVSLKPAVKIFQQPQRSSDRIIKVHLCLYATFPKAQLGGEIERLTDGEQTQD